MTGADTNTTRGESARHGQFVWLQGDIGERFFNPALIEHVHLQCDTFTGQWTVNVTMTGDSQCSRIDFDSEHLARRFVELLVDASCN